MLPSPTRSGPEGSSRNEFRSGSRRPSAFFFKHAGGYPMWADIFVSVAAILTTASFLPQAVKVVRSGETAGISLTMYAMFTVGVAFWLLYGIAVGSPQIILANAITLALAGTILGMKARSGLR